jgi:protease-4
LVGSDTLSRRLRKLRQDDEVKAVVFRINSPGGSAYAAEVIQRELVLLEQEKPLIISQGAYAASGGYWLSAPGDYIFSEPTTLTGSIGVYIMIPNFAGAAEWLGLTFDTVKTGDLATITTPSRSKTEAEMAIFQSYAEQIYEAFIDRVATGREMQPELVNTVAQGRVWLGKDAVKLGLVDELGGIRDAIDMAIRESGVGADYTIREYPAKKDFGEVLSEGLGAETQFLKKLKFEAETEGLDWLVDPANAELEKLKWFQDPRGVYALMPFELKL